MLGKVRPTTHRANGSTPQPNAGLSEGRLALVHRYMIDAEEAEAQARAAAEAVEARTRQAARLAAAVEEQTRREAAELLRRRNEIERRKAEALLAATATARSELGGPQDEQAPARPLARRVPRARTGLVAKDDRPPDAGAETTPRQLARADKRAAKRAARVIAALEKKEARERKALAKAAARRRVQASRTRSPE